MGRYIVHRLLLMIPTIIGASILVFTLIRLMPSDAVDALLGDERDPEVVTQVRERLGLNNPPVQAYFRWAGHILRGDLGTSLISGRKVSDVILDAMPTTLAFASLGMAIGLLISLPIGVFSAARQNNWLDYAFRGGAIMALAIPAFWVGIMAMALPGYFLNWLPPTFVPLHESVTRHFYSLLIPALILGVALSGSQIRLIRTTMLNVLREDFIRTARGKGLPERKILIGHGLRNAALPFITLIAIQVSSLVMGTVVLERVFGIPGLGQQLLAAISARDYPVLQGLELFFAGLSITIYFLVDVIYAYLDPRVKFS